MEVKSRKRLWCWCCWRGCLLGSLDMGSDAALEECAESYFSHLRQPLQPVAPASAAAPAPPAAK